jgi:hypothetical protein
MIALVHPCELALARKACDLGSGLAGEVDEQMVGRRSHSPEASIPSSS